MSEWTGGTLRWDRHFLDLARCCAAAVGPRYRALGNSTAVPVVRWILRRITEFEAR